MLTLHLDQPGLRLTHSGGTLSVADAERHRYSVPVTAVERLILDHRISLDSSALVALAAQRASVFLLPHGPGNTPATLHCAPTPYAQRRLRQLQLHQQPAWRLDWARGLVAAKLTRQRRVLQTLLSARPAQRRPLTRAIAALTSQLQAVHSATNSDRLRGLEGKAASSYFAAYSGLFAPALGFNGRQRRPPPDPVNACLSLAYTLLHGDAVQACHAAGLDACIGWFHSLCDGRESLASDLIEPLRASLDLWVWSLFQQQLLRADHFNTQPHGQPAGCRLTATGRRIFYREYAGPGRDTRRLLIRASHRLGAKLPEP